MVSENPFEWTHPGTWPWLIYVWLAVFAAGWLKPVWHFFERNRAGSWPNVAGQIEFVSASPIGNKGPCEAELGYLYSVVGNAYNGNYKRALEGEAEALEFIRDLKGKTVPVQYNPNKPSTSTLLEASIATLLRSRAPRPTEELLTSEFLTYGPAGSVPSWIKPYLWLFIGLSAIGFLLSLWVHLGALMGRRVAPEAFFWILHVGIFVVWFPAVYVAQRRVRNAKRRDYWKVVLRGCPDWLRYLVGGFFAYALVNFMLFIAHAPSGQSGGDPPGIIWRGFSGHWMVFYLTALAMLYSAIAEDGGGWRCPNGHPVRDGMMYCPECGQPLVRRL
jgi:hypothetical protein